MVNLKIDTIPVSVEEGTTILEAAKKIGIPIPTLCYLKDLNEIGACRVCIVEVKGTDKLVASCNQTVEEGMEVLTNSPRVRVARKTNVKLLLSQHDSQCPTCVRSGNCKLQSLSNDLCIQDNQYRNQVKPLNWDTDFPLIRDEGKCVKCMRCVQICDKMQTLGIWDVANTGSRTTVAVSKNRTIREADCTLCGQCIVHCPVGALRVRNDMDKVFEAIADPDKITVLQFAPAVRTAWGEYLGIDREFATVKRLVSAMRKVGFDYIFDTDFSADLTIMEEGSEFVEMVGNPEKHKFPLFTSCCPGWVRFMKSQYPDMIDQLSTAKSPQQMFGAIAKSYFAEKLKVDPSRIYVVSVMPCSAKKQECALPTMNDACGDPDVDVVLTTREISRMISAEHMVAANLEEEEFDSPLGIGSGAGVIFGTTGGVMEAALRSAYFMITGKNPDADGFKDVRGLDGWKESKFTIEDKEVRVAVASGLGNARKLVEAIRSGKVKYDIVEIMACPGGCISGGGQPIWPDKEVAQVRSETLYGIDRESEIRFSHENPSIKQLYKEFLGSPHSDICKKLLHTDHIAWDMPLAPHLQNE